MSGEIMSNKSCTMCKELKPLRRFSFRSKSKGIKHNACKNCMKIYTRKHYEDNKDTYKIKAKEWVKDNHNRRKAINRHYNAKNRGYKSCQCCTSERIREFYIDCPAGLHVDHIVTLSKSGLHCIKNMQYIEPSEHARKSNRERKELKDGR